MTHSDSITLLLDFKASDLVCPQENHFRLAFTKLIGKHEAQVFTATYQPKQMVYPTCGVISEKRKVRDYRINFFILFIFKSFQSSQSIKNRNHIDELLKKCTDNRWYKPCCGNKHQDDTYSNPNQDRLLRNF